jgi:sec-independent protein translocase protein TatA
MGSISPIHWLVVLAIVFLLFGNRLPQVMRSLGQGVVEFKKGLQGVEDDIKNSANRVEEQPSKPQVQEEVKPSVSEPVQR